MRICTFAGVYAIKSSRCVRKFGAIAKSQLPEKTGAPIIYGCRGFGNAPYYYRAIDGEIGGDYKNPVYTLSAEGWSVVSFKTAFGNLHALLSGNSRTKI